MREVSLEEPVSRKHFYIIHTIQWVKLEVRTESLDSLFEDREGGDVHLHVWTCGCLEGHRQNRVCLATLRVRQEQDFLGPNTSVAIVGVHNLSG